jgi:hypothetical protein
VDLTIAQTAAIQTVEVQGKNSDGNYGPSKFALIDKNYTPAVAQGSVAVETDGAWHATVDGPEQTRSFRWDYSTSAFPADATVAASGTLDTGNGRLLLGMTGTALTFGQTVYITIVPFDAVSGGGNALPTIHLRGAYQSYTATRTTSYGPGSFVELNDVLGGTPANGFTVSGSLQPNGNSTFDPEQVFYCIVVIPDGTTLTDVYADVFSENDGSSGGSAQGHNTSVRFDRLSSAGAITNLAAVNASDNGGWQALHAAMSESTTGRRYQIRWVTSQGSAPSTPSHTRLAGFYIVHTIPDPSKGI